MTQQLAPAYVEALATSGFIFKKIIFSEAVIIFPSQETNTCSKWTIKRLEEGGKYVQI